MKKRIFGIRNSRGTVPIGMTVDWQRCSHTYFDRWNAVPISYSSFEGMVQILCVRCACNAGYDALSRSFADVFTKLNSTRKYCNLQHYI
jgi:hypothetical protein